MFRISNSGKFLFLRQETNSKGHGKKIKNHEFGSFYKFCSGKFRLTHGRSIG